MINTFETGGDKFTIHHSVGFVVGSNKNYETQNNYYSSSTHIHDDFFIDHGNGQQTAMKLTDWDVAVMDGHKILLIWIIKNNDNEGPYVALKNLTTNKVYIKNSILDGLANKPKPMFPEGADLMQVGCLTIVIIVVTLGIGYILWQINYSRKHSIYLSNKSLLEKKINEFIDNFK